MNLSKKQTFDVSKIKSRKQLKPLYDELLMRNITCVEDLKQWLAEKSALESSLNDEFTIRAIRMRQDPENESFAEDYRNYIDEFYLYETEMGNRLDDRILDCEYRDQLEEPEYKILLSELQSTRQYHSGETAEILSRIMIREGDYDQAVLFVYVFLNTSNLKYQDLQIELISKDRYIREKAFINIHKAYASERTRFEELLDETVKLRQALAKSCGFKTYLDYYFSKDITPDFSQQDCINFHKSVKSEVLPLFTEILRKKRSRQKYKTWKPWDRDADCISEHVFSFFQDEATTIKLTKQCLERINPEYADFITLMADVGHFDILSKPGKGQGAAVYSFFAKKIPFLYFNIPPTPQGMKILFHECGHAVHDFRMNHLDYWTFRIPSSFMSETAAMAMELLSMEHWNIIIPDPGELKRIKRERLEEIVETFIHIAKLDSLEFVLYRKENLSPQEREDAIRRVMTEYETGEVDWSGYEDYLYGRWMQQRSLFTDPFSNFEYVIAQIAAVMLWRNYRKNPQKTIECFDYAMSLGLTRDIRFVFKAAGIPWDFSPEALRDIMNFIKQEWEALETDPVV